MHAGDALTAGVLQGEGVSLVHAGDALTAGVLQGEGGSEQQTVYRQEKHSQQCNYGGRWLIRSPASSALCSPYLMLPAMPDSPAPPPLPASQPAPPAIHPLLLRTLTLATFSATLYFCPSFSSSAITQSVMQGLHSAYRQSIMPRT